MSGAPPAPTAAEQVFGPALPQAVRYAEILCDAGLERGLLGPRETAVIWDRHVLNCAVVQELVPEGRTVVDVGSGAGLPGIPLALARPDLTVTLLEPLLRRTTFLTEVIEALGLGGRVVVARGRAETTGPRGRPAPAAGTVVVARAVAALDKLVGVSVPLIGLGGALVAIRGGRAPEELSGAEHALRKAGLAAEIVHCGTGVVSPPTTVVHCLRS